MPWSGEDLGVMSEFMVIWQPRLDIECKMFSRKEVNKRREKRKISRVELVEKVSGI